MHPILFNFGSVTIYSYGFMIAVTFLVATFVSMRLAKKEGIREEVILDLMVLVIISSILGARIFYVITFWDQFKNNLSEIIMINHGGLVFYGGFIGGLIAILYYVRIKQLSLMKILDIGTPTVLLGYSIGRIGCFLNGCCYGICANVPWAVKFPNLEGLRHPTQIYSFVTAVIIFLILLIIFKRRKFDGQIFYLGMILYSAYRFLIEFLREYSFHIMGLTSSQIISLIIFVFALALFVSKTLKASRS